MLRKLAIATTAAGAGLLAVAVPAAQAADPPLSGAIFTTDSSGVPVNLNQYPAKEAVYLNGGPGINAPAGAAGLPAGTYSFQVTDPSGKTLLSTDPVACRQFSVDSTGVIRSVAPGGGCAHATGADGEDGGLTVQLFPYDNTPNNGGVYKVWVTPTNQLDCAAAGNKSCFVPGHSKTDNFKVKNTVPIEIDTRFSKDGVTGYIDGLGANWTDTLGATNVKYSEYDPAVLAFHEAHVEAAEPGDHTIVVADQPGCTVVSARAGGTTYLPVTGKATVPVHVANNVNKSATYFVDVTCQ